MVGVLRGLVSVLSGKNSFSDVLSQLEGMLRLTAEMVRLANQVFWRDGDGKAERAKLFQQDIDVNKAERRIRKSLAMLTVAGSESDATYALRLMSLVKDVERLGDYAKNLADLPNLAPGALPDDEIARSLRQIGESVNRLMDQTIGAIVASDAALAKQLTSAGRTLAKDCDDLVKRCASSDYPAGFAVRVALAARFNKRIAAHLLNVLSSLIMPLHKLDFFDEPLPARG